MLRVCYCVAHVRASHQIQTQRQNLCHLFGPRVLPHGRRTPLAHGLQHHRPATRPPRPHRRRAQGSKLPSCRSQVQLEAALDYGGLAVLKDAWSRYRLDELLAGIGSARQRGLLQAIIFSRLLFPCAKLSLAQQAQGTWLAQACGLSADRNL